MSIDFGFKAGKLFRKQPDGSYRVPGEGVFRVRVVLDDVRFSKGRGAECAIRFSFEHDGEECGAARCPVWVSVGDTFSLAVDVPFQVNVEDL
jgi:hypothetical protein